jgi:hypothetical protein
VTVTTTFATGIKAFMAALEEYGAEPANESGLVTYNITPVSGAHAGHAVRTGVAAEELAPWPAAPPHWIHLPTSVAFRATNSRLSLKTDWTAHSRDIPAWGTATVPVAAWLAHVRGVLGDAV